MHKTLRNLAAIFMIAALSSAARADFVGGSEAQKRECNDLIVQMTSAIKAQDAEGKVRIGQRAVERCAGVADAKDMASFYSDIADGLEDLYRFEESLRVANTCISIHYQNAKCHVIRGRVLFITTGGKADWRKALRIAQQVGHDNIEQAQRKLASATHPSAVYALQQEVILNRALMDAAARTTIQLESGK